MSWGDRRGHQHLRRISPKKMSGHLKAWDPFPRAFLGPEIRWRTLDPVSLHTQSLADLVLLAANDACRAPNRGLRIAQRDRATLQIKCSHPDRHQRIKGVLYRFRLDMPMPSPEGGSSNGSGPKTLRRAASIARNPWSSSSTRFRGVTLGQYRLAFDTLYGRRFGQPTRANKAG